MFKIEITANSVTELKGELQKHLAELGTEEVVQAPRQTSVPVPTAPVQQPQTVAPTPTQSTLPVQQPQMSALPTATPQYTHDQLALAASTLAEANPSAGPQLNAIVQSYGVQGLSAIPVNQLGAVAQSFRQLGAVI